MASEEQYVAGNPALAGSNRLVAISGCSGGGKSTLVRELADRGYTVRPEAGRQIVKEQMFVGGDALPWENLNRFVELAASRASHHYNTVTQTDGTVFFDRTIIDVVSAFERRGIPTPVHLQSMLDRYRYGTRVLLLPPWQDRFCPDSERRHSFEDAVAEYHWLTTAYRKLGHEIVVVPKSPIGDRADFVIEAVAAKRPNHSR